MREITGDLWDHYGAENTIVLITTNGYVKQNGEAVMGRGCAKEAKDRFLGIAIELGRMISLNGNKPHYITTPLWQMATFPVKYAWYEKASLKLIGQSAAWLKKEAEYKTEITFVLPRPGCGNGGLLWREVRPLLENLPDNVWVISRTGEI